MVPNPSYPIHIYGPVIAGANVRSVAVHSTDEFLAELEHSIPLMYPRPKMLILNFPANPTTQCVELAFFERVVALCAGSSESTCPRSGLCRFDLDGYRAPSILRCRARRILRSNFSLFPRATTCLAGGWALWSAIRSWWRRWAAEELLRLRHIYADPGCFDLALEGPQECVRRYVITTASGAMCWSKDSIN